MFAVWATLGHAIIENMQQEDWSEIKVRAGLKR